MEGMHFELWVYDLEIASSNGVRGVLLDCNCTTLAGGSCKNVNVYYHLKCQFVYIRWRSEKPGKPG
jgi:hypothetical protein